MYLNYTVINYNTYLISLCFSHSLTLSLLDKICSAS